MCFSVMTARAHVFIEGVVQGVFFRANTERKALRLGLKGWVRNLPDGRVEALFQGDRNSVERMLRWCHRGPAFAKVSDVSVQWEEYGNEFSGFTIWYPV
ncbi:MAG: acylphosphatase [Candidatus Geothermarchaeales archaeon]